MASSETPVTEKRGQDGGKNHLYKSVLESVLLSVVIVTVVLVLLLPVILYHLPLPLVSTLLLSCAWLVFSFQVSLGLVSNVATSTWHMQGSASHLYLSETHLPKRKGKVTFITLYVVKPGS